MSGRGVLWRLLSLQQEREGERKREKVGGINTWIHLSRGKYGYSLSRFLSLAFSLSFVPSRTDDGGIVEGKLGEDR